MVTDPINVRYATDSTNMQVWCLHNPVRYAFVATEGPVIVFDFHGRAHLSDHLELVDEVRPGRGWYFFKSGDRIAEHAEAWAAELADLVVAWFQECSSRVIEAGDLVAFDTDLIGPYGYCADISRTWGCGDGRASNVQIDLYRLAREQIAYNLELVRPCVGFRELSEKAFELPERYAQNRYRRSPTASACATSTPLSTVRRTRWSPATTAASSPA